MSTCPTSDQLIAIHEGRPAPRWVAEHCRDCQQCREDLEALRAFDTPPTPEELAGDEETDRRLAEGWRRFEEWRRRTR